VRFFEYRKGAFVNLGNVRAIVIRADEPAEENVYRVCFQYSGSEWMETDLDEVLVEALRRALHTIQ
jgi:hypothetical protein